MPLQDFGDSEFGQKLAKQATQPAAPKGLRQAAVETQGYVGGLQPFEESRLGQQIVEQEGYVGAAQSWYTGANQEGMRNGWSTDFWDKAIAQNEEMSAAGTLASQFDTENLPTGVVTYDHLSSDGRHELTFGDVYEDGKFQGNLYKRFDTGTADLMMSDFLYDGKTKSKLFKEADVNLESGVVKNPALSAAVQQTRTENNEANKAFLTQQDFQGDVRETTEEFQEGAVDEVIAGGGAAGAGILAGGVVAATGVGAVPGAIIIAGSAAFGAASAWLNRDALTEQAARAFEITSMSNRENGTAAGIATGVSQWSGFGAKLVSPFSNAVQGGADAAYGETGDGTAAFYELNKDGERRINNLVKVADVVASVGDMAVQFATPIGATVYMGQMSGTIAGEVAELALTKGKTFDYRSGTFDNIFTDEDGNFDATSAAAGIGKIGIDVVQLGMARGLLGKVQSTRLAAGEAAVGATGRRVPSFLQTLGTRMYGGAKTGKEVAGFKPVYNEAGEVVGKRATLSLLAPSEQLSALSARIIAMRSTAKQGGAYAADDFFRAANALAAGEKKWVTTLVNGMGEGYEEAVQAVLEPHSHGYTATMEEIGNAALYGFAGGVGMGAGISARMPSAQAKIWNMAKTGYSLVSGGQELTRAEYDSWTEAQQRSMANLSGMSKAMADSAFKKATEDLALGHSAGVAGIHKLADAVNKMLLKDLTKGNPRVNGAFVITGLEDAGRTDGDGNLLPGYMPADAAGASAFQTVVNMVNSQAGTAVQLETVRRNIATTEAAIAADPTDPDAGAKLAELKQQETLLKRSLELGALLTDALETRIKDLYYNPDTDYQPTMAEIEAGSEAINAVLRDYFNQQQAQAPDGSQMSDFDRFAMAHAVGIVFGRDPHDQAGSYQVLVPQISPSLTRAATNDLVEVSLSILPAIRGDYDGDKIRALNEIMLNGAEYEAARAGLHFVGQGTSVNLKTPKYEKYNLERLSDSMLGDNDALANLATGTLTHIGNALRNRYRDVISYEVMNDILDPFFDAARTGEEDARQILVDGIALHAGGDITDFARGNLSNEWLWIDQLVRASLDSFQESYASRNPTYSEPNTRMVAPVSQSPEQKERQGIRAATLGGTVGLLLTGDLPFRQDQKLHYTSLVAAVLSAENAGTRAQHYALAQLYEALGQGLATSELEAIHAKDIITARVYARLQRVAMDAQQLDPRLNPIEAMTVIANLRVDEVKVDKKSGEVVPTGKQISLAQMLLKESVAQDRVEKDAIYDASDELQSKHNRLLGMTRPDGQGRKGSKVNASRAFVEVVAAQQLYTLMGEDSKMFGPHLTIEQFIRSYVAKHEDERRDIDAKMKAPDTPYGKRKKTTNAPYDLDEVAAGEVTAYRAVVDAIMAVGHNRITIDANKATGSLDEEHLHGELADRHYEASKQFRAGHKLIRQAVLDFGPRLKNESEIEHLARLFDTHRELHTRVMALIPTNAANAVLQRQKDGTVRASTWFYQTFLMEDSAHAEIHFQRNLILEELRAQNATRRWVEEEAPDKQKGRQYHRLGRRFHQLIHRLGMMDDGGLLLKQFMQEMESATSVEGFLRWVNTTPGIRGSMAPLTMWVDDVAEFDADKAQGGWSQSLQGAELREAVGNLSRSATMTVRDLAEEARAAKRDVRTLAAVERVIAYDEGNTSIQLESGDRALHDKMQTILDDAAEMAVGLGPAAMIYQTVSTALGYYPQAHTKAKNPDFLDPAAVLEAQRDAFGYVTNWERVMSSLTTQNMDAVGGNLGLLAGDEVRTMDDYGREVAWTKPTLKQMVGMFKKADQRPLARAVMFPQVLERDSDGEVRQKMLVGKSLKDMLDGATHKDLFPKLGTLKQDAALKYVSMVEARARRHGDTNFSVQRLANEIVIARTTAADHVLSVAELEEYAIEAYYWIAVNLQKTSSIAGAAHPAGVDPLAKLRADIRAGQREAAFTRRMNMKQGGKKMEVEDVEKVLDILTGAREDELEDEKRSLNQQASMARDPAEQNRLLAMVEAIDMDLTRFRQEMELLLDNDLIGRIRLMFTIDPNDQTAAAHTKDSLILYLNLYPDIMSRVKSQRLLWHKIGRQMQDSGLNGQLDLKPDEWTALSNAVIGVYMTDVATQGRGETAPFDEKHEKYYDVSFSYLADPLLDAESDIMKAAIEINALAKLGGGDIASDDEVILSLGNTIFKDFNYGQWTPEVVRASVEANERLDSAAAEVAVSMYGNSPKTQGVISAATRRTFKKDNLAALASTVTLGIPELTGPAFDEVLVTHPDGTTSVTPYAQLNNRFASSVMFTYTDALGNVQTYDLMAADSNVGRVWEGNDQAAGSGFQAIHLDRIAMAIDKFNRNFKLDTTKMSVKITFLHPDMQPVELDKKGRDLWMNNLFFEGTSFLMDADRHESLNATGWFADGSISPKGQANALEASKLGLAAMKVVAMITSRRRKQAEENWRTNFAGMLREKTQLMLETDMGFGTLEERPGSEMYNFAFKNLKMRHFVRHDGGLLTAEQVMKLQRAGEDLPQGAELWIPSDDVLRTMLGELGGQGVTRLLSGQVEFDLAKVPTYRGITPRMMEDFEKGIGGELSQLSETPIANRARQQMLTVRTRLTNEERNAYDQKMKYFAAEKQDIEGARAGWSGQTGEGGFNPSNNMAAFLALSDTSLRAQDISFDWSEMGIKFIGPRIPSDSKLGRMLLHELAASLQADGYRTGWIYREGDKSARPAEGTLYEENLGNNQPRAMQVAPGDPVYIELDSFNGDDKLMRKRLDHFIGRGATIVLGSESGGGDLRAEASVYLESREMARFAGNGYVYRPVEHGNRYQNQKARISRSMATRNVSKKSHLAILVLNDKSVEENMAWVPDPKNERLGGIATKINLIPTNFLQGMNVPATADQIAQVVAQLRGLDTEAGRAHMTALQKVEKFTPEQQAKADADFAKAWTRLMDRLDAHPGTVLPGEDDIFGTGDLIPLMGPSGLLLYRHGHTAPRRDQFDDMVREPIGDSLDGGRVGVYFSDPEAAATTHRGRVISVDPRSSYGLSIELDLPLSVYGDKKVLEWNGMKYLLAPKGKLIQLPNHGIFKDWPIDLIVSHHDILSKEAHEGLIDNHQDAFTYLGMDFLPDVAEHLGVDPHTARGILKHIASKQLLSVESGDELLHSMHLDLRYVSELVDALSGFTIPNTNWADELVAADTVAGQITRAIMVYLSMPGTRMDEVIKSGGFNDNSMGMDGFSWQMPEIFTQVFDLAPINSPLRVEINERLNAQLYNPNNDGTGYSLSQTFEFTVHNGKPGEDAISYNHLSYVQTGIDTIVAYAGVTPVARMNYSVATGEIGDLGVLPAYRRRGIATGMINYARSQGITITHSEFRTPAGEAWARSLQGDTVPALQAMPQDPTTEDADLVKALKYIKPLDPATQLAIGSPGKNLSGHLMFAEAHSSGDNPVSNGMSFDTNARQAVSAHSAAIAYQAIGASTAINRDIAKARKFASGENVQTFEKDVLDGGVWRLLTNISPIDKARMAPWRAQTPAEAEARTRNRKRMLPYRKPIDAARDSSTDDEGWTAKQRLEYTDVARKVLHELGLKDSSYRIFDYWVRQMSGADDRILGKEALEAAWAIHKNVFEYKVLPLVGAEVPLLHIHDLQLLHRVNKQRGAQGWNPNRSLDSTTTAKASSWDEWVENSFGGMFLSDENFHAIYRPALDGFMNTYQNATEALLDLPVSTDRLVAAKLLDEEFNRLVVSMDPNVNLLALDPVMLNVAHATVDQVLGGVAISGQSNAAPASERAKRRTGLRKWGKETGTPIPVDQTLRDLNLNGARYMQTSTVNSSLARILINMRVGTALLNPALYLSMGPEQWMRGTLDRAANLLTGQGTQGLTAKGLAKVGLSYYSTEEIAKLHLLYENLGDLPQFKAMIGHDLWFLRPQDPGIGKVEKVFAKYAQWGSAMQDPTRGMRSKTLARRYLDGVIQHIQRTPTLNAITTDQLVAAMMTNPAYLQDKFPEAHTAGINAVAQIRSLKETTLSKFLKGIYEPMSQSTHGGKNFFGNVVLRLPLLFSGYAMNVATTITGMQGVDQVFAAFMHGRKPLNSFVGRAQAAMRGETFDAEQDKGFDMDSVIEGIDLSRAFIRGGLTHTGLFMMGMMAGGLGLSGEDDETKKRRKMAQLQGVPFLYDPRRIENDFRNADAIFLDWLPGLSGYFRVTPDSAPGGARSMVQTHWMLRQFVSPIIGMERFFETGDFNQVTYGFQDALGAFPLINTMMWDDAVSTAQEFAKMADEESKLGGPSNMVATAGLLTNAVGIYERMLFENAFVNSLYTSFDKYDRNPYALPERDSDGDIQRDIENEPYAQGQALKTFIDPESGEIVTGYDSRDTTSGMLHALTENRATMAFALAMFTGLGDSDYLRRNMVVKTKTIEKQDISQDVAEALIRLQLQKQGGLPSLVPSEVRGALMQRNIAAGVFQDPDEMEAEANFISQNAGIAPMSVLDKDGKEVLTIDGARGIFRGLFKKSVGLDDLSLQGAYISKEMRETITNEWTKELVQDGLDLGLDQSKAESRMKRIMYGEFGTDQDGLADIIWKTPDEGGISFSPSATYNQLNTTYVMGPDGRPWATGFTRDGVLGSLGLKPVNRAYVSDDQGRTGTDNRLNTTDRMNGLNTGLRALELVDDTRYIPTDKQIGEMIVKAIEDAANAQYTPLTPFADKGGSGSGWRDFGGSGYRRRSYGSGGYSYGGSSYFVKMYTMPGMPSVYSNSLPFINTSNPIIRRADVRRERVWSERGRLKQWQ